VVNVKNGGLLAVALVEEVVLQGDTLAMLQAGQLAHESCHVRCALPCQLCNDSALWHISPGQHVAGVSHIHLRRFVIIGSWQAYILLSESSSKIGPPHLE